MLTRKRWTAPNYTGDARTDYTNLAKSISDYLLSLEGKNALTISQAQIYVDQGLQFPATQVSSSDPNNLDDYEESNSNTSTTIAPQGGAFTATATYNYTKSGNEVFVEAQAVITAVGTGTGVVDVNIPFLPARTTAIVVTDITNSKGFAGYAFNNGGQGQLRFFKDDSTTAIAVATFSLAAKFHV